MPAREGICRLRKTRGMALVALIFVSLLQPQSATAGSNPQSISGRVVDDATGEAIVDFAVQTSTRNFGKPEDVFWNHFMMGNAQNPGHFSARSPTSNEMVRIIALGYVPQILTEQSVTNLPASGLEIRLKRGDALGGYGDG